jgi:hypothetical protein|tara:strand:+ start:213 stop:1853 length:1641 start_codon:yes stop_codon:yes gene_type:complete
MTTEDIFLGSQASLTLVPEVDLYIPINHSNSNYTSLEAHNDWEAHFLMVNNLYVGCIVEFYDADATNGTTVPQSTHTITSNTANTIVITPAISSDITLANGDFIHIRGYGAPCVGLYSGSTKRLNADNWLGLLETGTFPNVEVEMKQLNLSLGGSRNFTHQYKGIETASGGNLALVANHGAFLYYALGKCTEITATFEANSPANKLTGHGANTSQDDRRNVYLDTSGGNAQADHLVTSSEFLEQGPIFYKTARGTNTLVPPLLHGFDLNSNLELLDRTTSSATNLANPITYKFEEANGEKLPSFALEQTMAKSSTLTTNTASASEDTTFVRIARGNRVNTLTMTANENEEVKMTLDLNTRAVQSLDQDENYEARGGITDNRQLFNFEQANNTSTTDFDAEFLEPFFFSSGLFSIFGQQFLKVTNLTLTINNNLQDKRFIGVGNKSIKEAIPAQRTYEVSFTAMVTDDKLFEELLNQTEVGDTSTTLLTLQFDKANGEQILMKFQDYYLSASNFTIPDDKGPITVEGTVMPRTLNSCTVKTHWVLQG